MLKHTKPRLLVFTTLHEPAHELQQISNLLGGSGYDVQLSVDGELVSWAAPKDKVVYINEIESFDLFLGIFFPNYGTGMAHQQLSKIINANKPRFILSHNHIGLVDKATRPNRFKKNGMPKKSFRLAKNDKIDRIELTDMYSAAVNSPYVQGQKSGCEVNEFLSITDIFQFLEKDLRDIRKMRLEIREINSMNHDQ